MLSTQIEFLSVLILKFIYKFICIYILVGIDVSFYIVDKIIEIFGDKAGVRRVINYRIQPDTKFQQEEEELKNRNQS